MPGRICTIDPEDMAEGLKFPTQPGRSGRGSGDGIFWNYPDYNEWHQIRFMGIWAEEDAPPSQIPKHPWTGHCCHYRQMGENRSGWPGLDGSGRNRAITCNRYHWDEYCAMCDLIEYCEQRGIELKGMGPQIQWLMNIVADEQAYVWGRVPLTVIRRLKDLYKNPRFGPNIFDPVKGRDFEVIRRATMNEKGKPILSSIEYDMVHCDPSPIQVPDWEDRMQVLDRFITRYDDDVVKKVIEQQLGDMYPVKECWKPKRSTKKKAARPTKAAKKRVVKKKKTKTTKATRGRKKR